jgi:hypothetical protein
MAKVLLIPFSLFLKGEVEFLLTNPVQTRLAYHTVENDCANIGGNFERGRFYRIDRVGLLIMN